MKPYKFQKEVVREIERLNGRSLVALEMGLGKTPTAIWYIKRNQDTTLPAVVVCPASVKWHWQKQIKLVTGWDAAVLEGQTPTKLPNTRIIIINYDILRFWLSRLKKLKPQLIVMDEVQFISSQPWTKKRKNGSKRTKATKSLCQNVPHLLGLSGTPLNSRPMELYNILQIIDPCTFNSRWTYGRRFCGPEQTPWGMQFKGASNIPELNKLLTSSCMIRRRKIDVLKDLPTKSREVLALPMKRSMEYNRANNDFLGWLRQQDPKTAKKAAKAESLVKVGYLLRLAARLKLWYVVEWINQFLDQTDEKLAVFAVHHGMIDAMVRRSKTDTVLIDGTVTGRNRQIAVDRFQNDSKARLLVGNIKAAGVGIDGLQRVCKTMAVAELPWTPGAAVQVEDRLWRIGAIGDVRCVYMVAHGTVEEPLCELLQEKQGVLSSVLDGGDCQGDLDIHDQLIKELRR